MKLKEKFFFSEGQFSESNVVQILSIQAGLNRERAVTFSIAISTDLISQ